MKIIEVNSFSDVIVEFQDKHHFRKRTTYANFNKGQIKNPYDKSVYEIGYIGEGRFTTWKNGKYTKEYSAWSSMLFRCYIDKEGQPTYYNKCIVCDEWLNFQTFCDWYSKNLYYVDERIHIDKDILYPGNNIYSPDTCLLVPQRINMLLFNKPNKRGLPNGISKTKYGYSATYNTTRLGSFQTLDEAFSYYAKAKEKKIQEVAEEYKNIIPKKVYNALLDYKVEMFYDKNYKIN